MADVRIVKFDLVGGLFLWLCRACTKARKDKGQQVLEQRKVAWELKCQDCEWKKRKAA